MTTMLTIGQLASYAGVTVRTVRHYHVKGLLPEPERDHSGYRRYGAAAVVELVKIRTLAEAGVPLSRLPALLVADAEEFAAASLEIDRRLQEEIAERERCREHIAHLASGDSLALPPSVVAYLARMRELGFRERLVELERDSWILMAAKMPDAIVSLMEIKRAQIEDPSLRELYLDMGDLVDCAADDPRLPTLADRVVAFLEEVFVRYEDTEDAFPVDQRLFELLDQTFLESVPCAWRLLELLEERGFTGWTNIQRVPAVR
jgi:DNA-binding transcriptional MerR regulator